MSYKITEYPKLHRWFKKLRSPQGFDFNLKGAFNLATLLKARYGDPVWQEVITRIQI